MYMIVVSTATYFDLEFLVKKGLGYLPQYAGKENRVTADFYHMQPLENDFDVAVTEFRAVNLPSDTVYVLFRETVTDNSLVHMRSRGRFDKVAQYYADLLEAPLHSIINFQDRSVMYTIKSDGGALADKFAMDLRKSWSK